MHGEVKHIAHLGLVSILGDEDCRVLELQEPVDR